MEKRKVALATLFSLSKKPFSTMGLIFTIGAVFFIVPFIFFISNITTDIKGTGYDYEAIYKNGTEKKARVTTLKTLQNVNVNNAHPIIVSYRYDDHGLVVEDHFETMDFTKTDTLKTGDIVMIKLYKGKSAIISMEQYDFPFFVFYTIPAPFIILGIIFLCIGFIPALKKYRLLQKGRVTDAHLLSLLPTSGMPISGRGKILNVYYYYFGKGGQKFFGEDTTADFSMMAFYKPEDIIKVAVDETNEANSCLMPPKEIKRNGWKV